MIFLESLVLAYFVFVTGYFTIMTIGGFLYVTPNYYNTSVKPAFHRFIILIPGYKEDAVIVETATHAFRQRYPQEYFDVIVIADSFLPETLHQLKETGVDILEVFFEKSTKVKSLQTALKKLPNQYDFVLLLDADNTIEENFLEQINTLINSGHDAIQAQRVAKNNNTSMAILDGLSEHINNFLYRQGAVGLGLSSPLIGSGMAFRYEVFKEIILGLDSIGGFDRELELGLLRKKISVFYAKGAFVYDEKVSSSEVFGNQRRRWLSSQFIYLKKYFLESWRLLFKGNFEFYHSGFIQNIQLPRLLNLGILFSLFMISFFLSAFFYYPYIIWGVLLLINILTLFIAVPRNFYNKDLLRAVFIVPSLFFRMFGLMFQLKGANKKFIHTPHGKQMDQTK